MTEFMLGIREQFGIVEEQGGYADIGTNTMAAEGFIPGKGIVVNQTFSHDWKEVLNAGDTSRNVSSFEKGTKSYPFSLTFKVTDWRFLKYCAHGTVTNTGSAPTVHTFTETNEVTSFTAEWAKRAGTNEVITLTGCIIKRVNLKYNSGSAPGEGFVEATCECVGKSISIGTSVTTLSEPTDYAFQFRMAKLTINSNEIVEVNSGEINIDNGIDENDSRYCNSTLDQEIGEPIPKVSRYTCRFNINQKDKTFSDIWDTEAAITNTNKLELIRGTNDDITFTFNTIVLKEVPSSNTNMSGINNLDMIGTIISTGIVANDARSDY